MTNKLPMIGKRYKNKIDSSEIVIMDVGYTNLRGCIIDFNSEKGIHRKELYLFHRLYEELPDQEPTTEESSAVEDISKMETTCCSCERSVIDRVKTGCIEVDGKTYCRHCVSLTHSDTTPSNMRVKKEHIQVTPISNKEEPKSSGIMEMLNSNVVKRANADNADALEYRKPTESMWKPISEEPQGFNNIVKDVEGYYSLCFYDRERKAFDIAGSHASKKEENGSLSFGGKYVIRDESEEYCTLNDFINHQKNLERRIERLEQLILNK